MKINQNNTGDEMVVVSVKMTKSEREAAKDFASEMGFDSLSDAVKMFILPDYRAKKIKDLKRADKLAKSAIAEIKAIREAKNADA